MRRFLGVDPGGSGAFAIVDEEGGFVAIIKLKETEQDVGDWLERQASMGISFAYLEKVHAFPGQGVSSTFKFGGSFGFCRGILIGKRIPWDFVTPQKWQKAMSCLTKGDKNVTKSLAQRLWPKEKIIHATADALLLAEFARRTRA